MVKTEIISRQLIKPSTPTPPYLRTFSLSFFDQISSPQFVPLILYYPFDATTKISQSEMSVRMKTSLSDALPLCYPLAGKIQSDGSVDCSDVGIDYLEARVEARLLDITESPQVEELSQLVQCMNYRIEEANYIPLMIQVNLFDCGGIAIGINFSHKIADACTFTAFLKAWASMARGWTKSASLVSPSFVASTVFPPKVPLGLEVKAPIPIERPITRRFKFTSSKIADLKAEVTANGSCTVQPTRVELVSALIWKRGMAQTGVPSVADLSVNIRGRMEPPLPENSFGNLFRMTYASGDPEEELASLVGKFREAIEKIKTECVEKLKGDRVYEVIRQDIKRASELYSNAEVDFFHFGSWCRFPFGEADFGWGKPVWVSSARRAFKNLILLLDSMCDDGIEAWVTMAEEDMVKFEEDPELLTFVS